MEFMYQLKEIADVAAQFLQAPFRNKVIAFHGDMGAGKTTLIHEICRQLKVENNVSSPTFSIINEYLSGDGNNIYHMDLYRIKDAREAVDAGVDECLNSGRMCLVEWPEKAPELFPEDTIECFITLVDANVRKLQIKL